MQPTILFPFIHTYGLMLAIGFYSAWVLALRRARKEGVDGKHISDLLIYTIISGVFGARLLYVLTEWNTFESFWDIFRIWQGGLVFYGGLATGTATLIAVIVRRKLSIAKIADTLGPAIALGLMFGRIGCFSYGCCWGQTAPPHYPLAVQFPGRFEPMVHKGTGEVELVPEGSPAFMQHATDPATRDQIPRKAGPARSLPVYPAQLFESFDSLLICLITSFYFRFRRRYGEVFLLFGFLYSLQRFILEFCRADNRPLPFFAGLTISQAVSLVFGAFCVVMFIRSRLLPGNVVAAAPARLDRKGKPANARG